ncbi:MAG: MFS transporter [Dysgonamonadaceae bacterium]|jgi:DHA3 family macrolide efflux protein-like MFS transporter|nr:MFS transporter [Dysgonamonadaceae bacterium]
MTHWKKTFSIIWAGQFLSILSSTIVNFAVILWLSIETGSAEMLAYAAIAGILPQAVLGPISGVFIDRLNRKTVMILADSFIAFCTLLLAVAFLLNIAELWHIFVLLALRSVGSAFHIPAMQASIPLLAPREQLARVAGINQIISSTGNIAGPALGAFFLMIWDLEYVLLLDVIGAAMACISLLFVHIPNPEKTTDENINNIIKEMKEGAMAVLSNKNLSLLFLFSIIVIFFLMPVSVLFPLMTLEHFSGNEFQVSLIEVVWGVGMLLGGAIMSVKVYRINKVILINYMYLVIGVTFLLSGLLDENGFTGFAVLTAIGGISGAVHHSSFAAIVQTNINPDVLGRVFSLFFTISLIPSMIGLAGIGFFADNLGLTATFILCGAVIMIVGIIAFLFPSTMQVDKK